MGALHARIHYIVQIMVKQDSDSHRVSASKRLEVFLNHTRGWESYNWSSWLRELTPFVKENFNFVIRIWHPAYSLSVCSKGQVLKTCSWNRLSINPHELSIPVTLLHPPRHVTFLGIKPVFQLSRCWSPLVYFRFFQCPICCTFLYIGAEIPVGYSVSQYCSMR